MDVDKYYEKLSNVCCTQPVNRTHKSWEEARDYCDRDEECRYIYDPDCNDTDFLTCHKGTLTKIEKIDVHGCVHVKGILFKWNLY